MKTKLNLLAWLPCAMALGTGSLFCPTAAAQDSAHISRGKMSASIPWSPVGAKAGADCQGDGFRVIPSAKGARLRCVFQRLEGEATREGLWLTSTVTNAVNDHFRVVATEVGRVTPYAPGHLAREKQNLETRDGAHGVTRPTIPLPNHGKVMIDGQTVRFTRPGLVEEYAVSMDGVRQDFVVTERPAGAGEMTVRLAVSGAKIEPTADGVRLVLENSRRKIAYSRLRVTDTTGRELTAHMEIEGSAAAQAAPVNASLTGETRGRDMSLGTCRTLGEVFDEGVEQDTRGTCAPRILVVMVNDTDAVYPLRIDPTFSDANWISMGGIPGANGTVYATVVDSSGSLYIGGSFTFVGDVFATNVAKWNGSGWSALGSGVGVHFDAVYALAVSESSLYTGGYFTVAGSNSAIGIAKWDGSSWSPLGSGLGGANPYVTSLAVSGSNLYVAGSFTTAGGVSATNVARWDGSSWSALGSGMNYRVWALSVSGTNLYAGGEFTRAGGISAVCIAKWNGSVWSGLGGGLNDYVYALAVSGTNLYAGGAFTTAGGVSGVTARRIAKWNGSSWSALGSGIQGGFSSPYIPYVYALTVSGTNLYAGGTFTTAGGSVAYCIAKWNGSLWAWAGISMDGEVRALAASGADIYAGGAFGNRVVGGNGTSWWNLGSGLNSQVTALAVSGADLYAGGYFTSGGSRIARRNGNSWSALGLGMSHDSYFPSVRALAVSGPNLYAGGQFTRASGNPATNIAKWNGSSWSALGSGIGTGFPDAVSALTVSGADLYAAGSFTNAGGKPAVNIAKWDGANWSRLDSGVYFTDFLGQPSGKVSALAVLGTNLYVGGDFTTAGGNPATNIAAWNGSNWSGVGLGIHERVFALAVSGNDLYAAGAFTNAGGVAANYVAKWDGNSWSALSSGVNGWVYALAVVGSDLYVGGYFTMAGSNPATSIARWNGTNWSVLGSGINGTAYAFAVSGNDLYVGGGFTTAGGNVSAYIARAYLPTLPALSVLRSGSDEVMVSWPSADTVGFALEQADTLTAPASWDTSSATVTDDGTNKSVTLPATNNSQFFRLRRP